MHHLQDAKNAHESVFVAEVFLIQKLLNGPYEVIQKSRKFNAHLRLLLLHGVGRPWHASQGGGVHRLKRVCFGVQAV